MHPAHLIHYASCRRYLHWISAPAVLMALYTGFYLDGHLLRLPLSNYRLHVTLGVLILLLTLCRLMCAWKFPLPAQDKTRLERLAGYTHVLFYILLLLQPALGIASKLGNGKSLTLIGDIVIPPLLVKGSFPAKLMMEIHELTGKLLLVLVCLHIAAAMLHQFVLKDKVLRRMIPAFKVSGR